MVTAFLTLLLLLPAAPAPAQFKSQSEAEAAFDSMYGGGSIEAEEVSEDAAQDEFNSIRQFLASIAKNNKDTVYVAYGAPSHLEAATLLRSFLARLRKIPVDMADSDISGILIVEQRALNPERMNRAKTLVLGGPSDNRFIQSMEKAGRLTTSKTKAQFRLFREPNCLVIACRDNKMFLEMVRVLVRSHDDFEEAVYSYFYLR